MVRVAAASVTARAVRARLGVLENAWGSERTSFWAWRTCLARVSQAEHHEDALSVEGESVHAAAPWRIGRNIRHAGQSCVHVCKAWTG